MVHIDIDGAMYIALTAIRYPGTPRGKRIHNTETSAAV
jgi:hypothetical protein